MIRHWLHRLAHWFGTYSGTVTAWHSRDGRVMVGFVCDECLVVSGVHESAVEPRAQHQEGT